jgi:uncharacterized protein YodC (DUF2158 family)
MPPKKDNRACDCGWVAWFGRHRASKCVCKLVLRAASDPQPAMAYIYRKMEAAARAEAALALARDEGSLKGEEPNNAATETEFGGPEVTERSLEEVMSKLNHGQCDCKWVSAAGNHRKNRCVYRIMFVAAKYPHETIAFMRRTNTRPDSCIPDYDAGDSNSTWFKFAGVQDFGFDQVFLTRSGEDDNSESSREGDSDDGEEFFDTVEDDDAKAVDVAPAVALE